MAMETQVFQSVFLGVAPNSKVVCFGSGLFYLVIWCWCCIINFMIEKRVNKHRLDEHFEIRQNLEYWLGRAPEERLAAVDLLRRQLYGDTKRLQRISRIVQRSEC